MVTPQFRPQHELTDRFVAKKIIMQFTVFSPIECTASLRKLGALSYKRKGPSTEQNPILLYKDSVRIPSLGMIDDALTMSKCGIDSVMSNAETNCFVETKRLDLSEKKCNRMHVGKKTKK